MGNNLYAKDTRKIRKVSPAPNDQVTNKRAIELIELLEAFSKGPLPTFETILQTCQSKEMAAIQ
jgi:hypothetical protein